ncbi:MAG: glycosyltransferase family 4 protein, partial [Acidobacteria bacterium]|nr:glycosyltransferase family 4 protein [Acidobacteriota bacterium]
QHHPLIKWFPLNPEVEVKLTPDLRDRYLPAADVIIATAFETAFAVNEASNAKGRKYYFIQHFEDWDGEAARVRATWQLPLQKVVVSQWLLDIASELGVADDTTYIPYGLNFSEFHTTRPIAERTQPCVAMMTHSLKFKGTPDGLEALRLVKQRIPELQAVLFGVEVRPANAPEWCEYIQQPSLAALREIYNGAAAFLCPSISEGWGLPAMEAMACGCALVAADNQGVRDFTTANENALLAPVRRPDLLAESLYDVLTNDNLRVRLATAAEQSVRRFTWDRSVNAFERLLLREPMSSLMQEAVC